MSDMQCYRIENWHSQSGSECNVLFFFFLIYKTSKELQMQFSDAHFDLQNTDQIQKVTFSFIPVLQKSMSKHTYSYE